MEEAGHHRHRPGVEVVEGVEHRQHHLGAEVVEGVGELVSHQAEVGAGEPVVLQVVEEVELEVPTNGINLITSN